MLAMPPELYLMLMSYDVFGGGDISSQDEN